MTSIATTTAALIKKPIQSAVMASLITVGSLTPAISHAAGAAGKDTFVASEAACKALTAEEVTLDRAIACRNYARGKGWATEILEALNEAFCGDKAGCSWVP